MIGLLAGDFLELGEMLIDMRRSKDDADFRQICLTAGLSEKLVESAIANALNARSQRLASPTMPDFLTAGDAQCVSGQPTPGVHPLA